MLRHMGCATFLGRVFLKKSLNMGPIFHAQIPMGLISKIFQSLLCKPWTILNICGCFLARSQKNGYLPRLPPPPTT